MCVCVCLSLYAVNVCVCLGSFSNLTVGRRCQPQLQRRELPNTSDLHAPGVGDRMQTLVLAPGSQMRVCVYVCFARARFLGIGRSLRKSFQGPS